VTTGQIERLVRRWKRRFETRGKSLELVIVDYLQRVRPDRQTNGRTEEITQVSLGLKECAKLNDVGLLATAQLSREVEKRHDKRPTLSDLRESGQIEQDADAVLFLFRPEYYVDLEEVPPSHPDRLEWEESKRKVHGHLDFICAKQRQGRTGVGRGTFYGNFQAVR
jgi:replicative DNA helicase